jgi:uncharacterized protein YdhG (YjbR/CyaY superfamily)
MDKQVNAYIELQSAPQQECLKLLRELVLKLTPEAEEGFSYGMPAYRLAGKPLIYFAAYSKHIGLYALPSAHAAFSDELKGYKQGKGSVQFPVDKELPLNLIARMIAFRITENQSHPAKQKKRP